MAIRLRLNKTERILFCGSKWWGDPDMPENMQYPTMTVEEEGEKYEYPLTFICQINCEDIAKFDPEGKLPHEGMLYFFGAIDELLGYESPTPTCIGEWPKGHFVDYTIFWRDGVIVNDLHARMARRFCSVDHLYAMQNSLLLKISSDRQVLLVVGDRQT